MKKVTLNQVINVPWINNLLWDVRFEFEEDDDLYGYWRFLGLDKIFHPNNWFPAVTVEVETAEVSSTSIDVFTTKIQIPTGTSNKTIKIDFPEVNGDLLFKFFGYWMNSTILGGEDHTWHGPYVSSFSSASRRMVVTKYMIDHHFGEPTLSETNSYMVFPYGSLAYSGDSTGSSFKEYSMNFHITSG